MNSGKEVIVVGGGVVGAAIAYELSMRSIPVLLLDCNLPGRATSASAGGLWPVGESVGLGCGVIYHSLPESVDSANGTPDALPQSYRDFLIASNERFPQLSADLLEGAGVDIEFAVGEGLMYLLYTDREEAVVANIARVLPNEHAFQMLSRTEVHQKEPNITGDLRGGALLLGEHQVNPMLLAEAYKRAAIANGAEFRNDARVTALRRIKDRIVGVEIGQEFIGSDVIVNAAGSWSAELAASGGMKLPVFPVRGQVVLTQCVPDVLRGCISTSDCYLTQKMHGEILIGSTTERAGFDVSVTQESIQSLCRGAIRAIPMLEDVGVKRIWSGLRPGTPDELPILGRVDGVEGFVNATGGFRTGIVAAPLTAELVAQVIADEEPTIPMDPFLVSRFSTGSV